MIASSARGWLPLDVGKHAGADMLLPWEVRRVRGKRENRACSSQRWRAPTVAVQQAMIVRLWAGSAMIDVREPRRWQPITTISWIAFLPYWSTGKSKVKAG